MIKSIKSRMSSYVDRGNELIKKGNTQKAMQLVSKGLRYYSERIAELMKMDEKNRQKHPCCENCRKFFTEYGVDNCKFW